MGEPDSIGDRLRRARRDRVLTQEQLAERAGVSRDLVRKLEQGRRSTARLSSLVRLADALDIELSTLVGKRPRVRNGHDVSVLAMRDAILTPDALPGVDADDAGEPTSLAELRTMVEHAWRDYWSGEFGALAERIPALLGEARLTHRAVGADVSGVLAQTYQVVADLFVHFGLDDLAAIATERALRAADGGDDELQWAALHGTYSWVMQHQGRFRAAEDHAVRIAERVEPVMSKATPEHLTVWGGLLLTAQAPAAAAGRTGAVREYLSLARTAAVQFTRDRLDYQMNFGRTQVAMQSCYAYSTLREPDKALRSASGVRRQDLRPISYGAHLLDVAHAQYDARQQRAAIGTLTMAREGREVWFRHQGIARTLVADLIESQRRLSPELRSLARAVAVQ